MSRTSPSSSGTSTRGRAPGDERRAAGAAAPPRLAAAAIPSPRTCTRLGRRRRCRRRRCRLPRLRQPHRAGRARAGETVLDLGSGGGIDVLLSARRVGPTRQGVRPRHDRRDAGAGAREPAEGRRRQRRVPQGRDRGDPAAGQLSRRHHLQLRHQSLGRQGPRLRRGVPRLTPGRAASRSRTSWSAARCRRRSGGAWSSGSGAWRARSRKASTRAKLGKAGFEAVDLEPTRIYRTEDARDFLGRRGHRRAAIAPRSTGSS